MINCTGCKQDKSESEFYKKKGSKTGLTPKCKTCVKSAMRVYYQDNSDRVRGSVRDRRTHNPELIKSQRKTRAARLRAETFDAYGGKCACCGESNHGFLTLDHVNNDGGGKNRKLGGVPFYSTLKSAGFPTDGLRLLCYNCNCGRAANGGICPHEIL